MWDLLQAGTLKHIHPFSKISIVRIQHSKVCRFDLGLVIGLSTFTFAGPDGVARGEDALSLLENSQTRSQFINELKEVQLLIITCIRQCLVLTKSNSFVLFLWVSWKCSCVSGSVRCTEKVIWWPWVSSSSLPQWSRLRLPSVCRSCWQRCVSCWMGSPQYECSISSWSKRHHGNYTLSNFSPAEMHFISQPIFTVRF